MKVVVTGAGGMLAQALVPKLREGGADVVALSRGDLDVTDRSAVEDRLHRLRPDAVVQCAAFTNVDGAEASESEAFRINAGATADVAAVCQSLGAVLVYPSTDYVFSGESDRAYRPSDPTAPLNAYGRSKAAGEEAARAAGRAVIVRTSWLYGAGGRNFVETICRLGGRMEELRIVDDQVGLPTWTSSLSGVIVQLLKVKALGTFHAADSGESVSWYQFAQQIFLHRRMETRVLPVSSADYGASARRPRYSVLDCSATEAKIGMKMPVRDTALAEYMSSLGSA